MTTCTNIQIKNFPNQILDQKLRTFYVRNSIGQFQSKSLNSQVTPGRAYTTHGHKSLLVKTLILSVLINIDSA